MINSALRYMAECVSNVNIGNKNVISSKEQFIDPGILRARNGVEAFKLSYERGNNEWKSLVTQTQIGQELQAMYLGLKPALSIDYIDPNRRGLLQRNLGDRFGFCGDMIYDRSLVGEVIATHTDVFSNYSPNTSVDEYMEQLDRSKPTLDSMTKMGIVLGYPKGAVSRFIKYYHIAYAFRDVPQSHPFLSPSEQALLNGYVDGYFEHRPRSQSERLEGINKFRNEHIVELKGIIEKVFPDATEDAKNYLLTERFVQLPGFRYNLGNPTQDDQAFAQKVRDIFEVSGMNGYIDSLHSTEG